MVIEDIVKRKIGRLAIGIDRGLCISTANCMKVSPEMFEFDDENICAFKENPPDIDRERVVDSCTVCPVDALTVVDEDGKQLVP